MFLSSLTFLFVLSRCTSSLNDGVLPVLVQQVCRHGDRSPANFFPNNKHLDYWVQGPGYLTPKGEKQLYDNGLLFRSEWYPGLLSDIVLPSEAFVICSHVGRTIMSANSFMAAVYPPMDQFVFEQGLNWQAFPTHSISPEVDYYLAGTDCPEWGNALDRIHSSDEYLFFLAENQQLINETCEAAGYSPSQYTIGSLARIEDNLICDSAHGLSLPPWATEEAMTKMTDVLNVNRHFQYSDPTNNFLDTGGGPLLGRMLSNIQAKINNSSSLKFIYFSGHDTTVLPFLGNFGQDVGPNPPYGSCGVLELYKDSSDNYYVQLSFRNSTIGMEKQTLMIPGCDDLMCDYATFLKAAQPLANDNPAYYCNNPKTNLFKDQLTEQIR